MLNSRQGNVNIHDQVEPQLDLATVTEFRRAPDMNVNFAMRGGLYLHTKCESGGIASRGGIIQGV